LAQPVIDQETIFNDDAAIIADANERFTISFSVPKTPYYRFKYGPLGKIDCQNEQGHSEALLGLKSTKIDVTEDSRFAAGSIFKIRILGA